jgi:hypothetical protein
MRREHAPGERNVREIVAIGVDPGVERDRRADQAKTVSRAGA